MGRGFKGFNRKSEGFMPWAKDFAYTGDVQTIVIPHTALYKLEVWGGSGGCNGGNGGYSIGYKPLKKGMVLYVCCGGVGGTDRQGESIGARVVGGGYNGGGYAYGGASEMGGGGGATHIAFVTGTLRNIGKTSFVDNSNGLIVAGGGGGNGSSWNAVYGSGGYGGGLSGGDGSHASNGSYGQAGTGGTQTEAGHSRYVNRGVGGFGYGGNAETEGGWIGDDPWSGYYTYFRRGASGGGGGFYGGGGGHSDGYPSFQGGGGGSGWIGGVPELAYRGRIYTPAMYSGSNGGNGKAKITLIK